MQRSPRSTPLGVGVGVGVGLGAVAVVAGVALLVRAGVRDAADYADTAVLVPLFWAAGAVAFAYRPQLTCARLLFSAGTLIAVSQALATVPAVVAHGERLWVVNLTSQVCFSLGFACWGAVLALFPDGRRETRAETVFVAGFFGLAVLLPGFGFFATARQPLIGVVSDPATVSPGSWAALAPFHTAAAVTFAAPLIGVVLMVLRYRRAERGRRAQLRWPVTAAAAAAASVALSAPVAWLAGDTGQSYLFVLGVGTLPVALLIGMVRDGLFDIDRLVLRSLVFGVLWLLIAGAVAGAALLLGVEAGRQLALGPAVAVAIVAAMCFQPARTRLERWADRRVYGARLSGIDAMRRLGTALEHSAEADDIAAVVASTVRRGLQCGWARVRIVGLGDGGVISSDGQDSGTAPDLVAVVRHAGTTVGWIECGAPRSTGSADRVLLEDLARQVAPALHNAELTRSLAGRLTELEASRARLVRAEETERRRIERDLHDGVQGQLVALAAKIEVARLQQVMRPAQLPETLEQLADAVRQTHIELRELVRGIHPAALADHGLVRAIEDRTASLPLQVTIRADASTRDRRLPVHLEGAAYFFAIEGITNVVRHAGVPEAVVAVSRDAEELRIEVIDAGAGFVVDDLPTTHGLRGLADRLQALGGQLNVTSAPGAGTRLVGVLPVAHG